LPKRSKLLGALLGLSLSLAGPGLQAAEQIVLVSGAFRRSIPVADFTHLAETGQARGLLADLLSLSRQDPAEVSKLLNQPVSLPLVLTSRLLGTRIGRFCWSVWPGSSRHSALLRLAFRHSGPP